MPETAEPQVIVLADPAAVSRRAADVIAGVLIDAVQRRGHADWATTGGSTPVGIYGALAVPPLRDAIPWDQVQVWFGDDRYVPRDHPLSNVVPVDEILLEAAARAGLSGTGAAGEDVDLGIEPGVMLPSENIHAFPFTTAIGENRGPSWAAAEYARELRSAVELSSEGWPVFDLVLLGIGPDGHLLSVFPGSSALTSSDVAMAIPAPTHIDPKVERVTLNPQIVAAARTVLAVAHGSGKAEVIGRIFGTDLDPSRLPSQLARRGGATWILDSAAAAQLPGELRVERTA